MNSIVKSVSADQTEIIRNILRLHVPGGKIDCDPTYSRGAFYDGTGIETPGLQFDIHPQAEGVARADARQLPLGDDSINCMIFDPPFPNERELHRFYIDALHETHRVLKPEGILIFKCQDKVSSGKQYFSHVFIMNEAVEAGFYPKDLFILTAGNRLTAKWQARNQQHARKYHCYFWVFQKTDRRIQYA